MASTSSRPLLLPQNRRIRHLQGISLRNLTFLRPRGRTIDDTALSKSPAKLEALRENALHHAHSTESLRSPTKLRRRSTNLVPGSLVSAGQRQKRLEDVIDSRVADVFFSIHCDGEVEPIYISELEERAINFNFRLFDLANLAPWITRHPLITLKIWAKRKNSNFQLLIEDEIDLRRIHFLGTLQNQHFPPNSIIIHLVDGVYAVDLLGREVPPAPPKPTTATQPTSSYAALMRLARLDESIQDARATRDALAAQINELLSSRPADPLPTARESVQLARRYTTNQRRALTAARRRRSEAAASLEARRAAITEGRALQERAQADVRDAAEKLTASQHLASQTREQIRGQRRRICEDLMQIYRIEPVDPYSTAAALIPSAAAASPLSFQICGLPLPNTAYDPSLSSAAEEALSAALTHAAALAHALQFYLGVPLPYPLLHPVGSRAAARDDTSTLPDAQREFPLWVRGGGGAAHYRFDYGWFLLNKDVEVLCQTQGLKVVDIRHTLPNLKYLLYVCSAGTEELPERKRGGVRGLWAGRMKSKVSTGTADGGAGSAEGSRRGSADSELLAKQREELRKAIAAGSKKDVTGPLSPLSPLTPPVLPFNEEGTRVTLRTKGLRENVVK